MQLDRTRIAIHERSMLDTLDMSLHVTRDFLRPIAAAMAVGVLPFVVVNQLLLGWMLSSELMTDDDYYGAMRYVWNMVLLVFIEAPLASAFATMLLGRSVFMERPSLRQVIRSVISLMPRLLLCQLLLRGVLPALALAWAIDRVAYFSAAEFFLIFLAGVLALWRSFRPFMNEIVLLERNPLRSADAAAMTIRRRSGVLHNAAAGELFVRWFVDAIIGGLLFCALFGGCMFAKALLLRTWSVGPVMLQVSVPLCLWIVAGFLTVVRFLNYLDVRIRQEGWEVELKMRAEGARLASRIA